MRIMVLSVLAACLLAGVLAAEPAPMAATCHITETPAYGAPAITDVWDASWDHPENLYWANWESGGTAVNSLKLVVKYGANGQQKKQVHVFAAPIATSLKIPFAVGMLMSGETAAMMIFKTDAGTCRYNFNIYATP